MYLPEHYTPQRIGACMRYFAPLFGKLLLFGSAKPPTYGHLPTVFYFPRFPRFLCLLVCPVPSIAGPGAFGWC